MRDRDVLRQCPALQLPHTRRKESVEEAPGPKVAEALEEGDDHEADIYNHIELMLFDSILNAVDRHPAENVRIANPNAHLEIESRVREFVLSYELKDKIGNKYQSIEVPIDIKDERPDGGILEVEVEMKWGQS